MEYLSRSEADTEDLGRRLAAALSPGAVVAYRGGLGMGKTAFTRGLAIGLGAGDVASSPTFALVNEYQGRLVLDHFDMYRIETWEDLESTGFFDYLESDRVLAIEWSENIEGALPEKRIAVDIQPGQGEDQRRITIDGWKGWL